MVVSGCCMGSGEPIHERDARDRYWVRYTIFRGQKLSDKSVRQREQDVWSREIPFPFNVFACHVSFVTPANKCDI